MIRLAIKSSRIVLPGKILDGVVLIEQGIITDIVKRFPETGFTNIDTGDKVLMPGIVDPHVHINEPGRTEWEGFDTATRAALAGGITTLVDMPLNSSPVTTTAKAFDEKLNAAIQTGNGSNGLPHVNLGFWGGVIPGNENDIEPLIKKGVLGFKAFLTHSGIDEFPNATEADLKKVMPIIARHNLPLLVHCELPGAHAISISDDQSYNEYLASRPAAWENDAIALMIRLCKEFNCRTHIVHLSSAEALTQIKEAKENGIPITVETGQHYLYFNSENIPDGRTEFKCAPPIRESSNNELLWEALKDGLIDFVATDHSPAPPELKEMASGNFTKAWGGIASLQFSLPVLWTKARSRGIDLTSISKWLCENPSRLPGLDSHKGKIEKGFDADLVSWNPEKTFVVTADKILHRHKITPYMNETLYGVVDRTWLAGHGVYAAGKFLNLNKGKIITRS